MTEADYMKARRRQEPFIVTIQHQKWSFPQKDVKVECPPEGRSVGRCGSLLAALS